MRMTNNFVFIYFLLLSAAAGAAVGSFVNCAAWRYVHGGSALRGRSCCPACGHTLGAAELIPIFSWLALRGRCSACKEKISPRYPLTELLGAMAWVTVFLRFGLSLRAAEYALLLMLLMCAALIDLEAMVLPDGILAAAALAWLGFAFTYADPLRRIGGGVLAALVYGGGLLALAGMMDALLHTESLGGGDVKLIAVLGLYLGWQSCLLLVLLASILGIAFSRLPQNRGRAFPFGPPVALAAWPCCLAGEFLISAYLSAFSL